MIPAMRVSRVNRSKARDRRGRLWQIASVPSAQADQEDFRFWYTELTPEERVEAVYECLQSALKARGIHGAPRLRRVARRVQRAAR